MSHKDESDFLKRVEEEVAERTLELELERDMAILSAKSKSDFLANMSHEIRTPMNGVLGMLYALRKCKDPDKRQKLITTAIESGKLLTSIIDAILEFSKFESVGVILESIEFDLVDGLEAVAQNFATSAQSKGLDLVMDIDAALPSTFHGDITRIKQVVGNLINNAIKFTDSGEITLRARYVDIETVKISVIDTGIGMNSQQQEQVFRAFSQADNSITRQFGGTGLGLSISSKIIEAMDSEIELRSELDKGSEFSFILSLPVVKEDPYMLEWVNLLSELCLVVISESETRKEAAEDLFTKSRVGSFVSEKSVLDIQEKKLNAQQELRILLDLNSLDEHSINKLESLKNTFASLKVIALSSYNKQDETSAIVDVSLLKPLRRTELLNALCYGCLPKEQLVQLSQYDFSNIKLLVVDDNFVNLQVVQEIFGDYGFRMDFALSGEDAVSMVQEERYDLVFMDVQMPGMDGYSTTAAIRSLGEEYRKLLIIAMTAHAMAEDRESSIKAGMNDHITKPLEPDEIFPLLEKLLGEKILKKESNTGDEGGLEIGGMQQVEGEASDSVDRPIPQQENTEVTASSEVAATQRTACQSAKETTPEKENTHPLNKGEQTEIPDLAGFDLPSAIKRVRGKWDRLQRLIISFINNNSQADKQMMTFIEQADFKQAERLAHQLKGSGANLGAVAISSISGEIERLIKSGVEEIPLVLLEEFCRCVHQLNEAAIVLGENKKAESRPAAPDQGAVKRENVEFRLGEISRHLDTDIGKVENEIEELITYTAGSEFESLARELFAHFGNFNMQDISKNIDEFMRAHR